MSGRWKRPRALLAVATWLMASGGAVAGEKTVITVLFTSDLHAHVVPYDLVSQRPSRGSLAQVATLVDQVRATAPDALVLDGGDVIEGTALGYYAIAAPGAPGVDPTVEAMNLVGYDAAVVGNHEFNFGLEVLRRSLSQARFPWLAADLVGATEAGLPVQGEVVFERGGVRIGVLGLTNPNVPGWEPREHWAGLTFADPLALARERVAALHRRVDVVVVIAHTGFERDPSTGEDLGDEEENYAWRLAQVPGIDVLLTGHTHRDIPPRELAGTIVAQPGGWAELVTRVELELDHEDGVWRRVGWRGENLPVGDLQPASRVVIAAQPGCDRAEAALSRPIGELAAPLVTGGVAAADDPAVDLIHAVQLAASGAQLSLAAPLSRSRIEFPAGPITPRLAHALYVYPNTLVVVRLTGQQVLDVLEHAVAGWLGAECRGDGGWEALRDPRYPPYTFDTLEGATYLVDLSAPVGRRIRGLRVAGRLVALRDSFTAVINSYRASGGGGFPHLRDAERVKEIGRPMVELLTEYLAGEGVTTPFVTDNWAFTLDFAAGLAGVDGRR